MSDAAKSIWLIIALALMVGGFGLCVYGAVGITLLLGPPWSYVLFGIFAILLGASIGDGVDRA